MIHVHSNVTSKSFSHVEREEFATTGIKNAKGIRSGCGRRRFENVLEKKVSLLMEATRCITLKWSILFNLSLWVKVRVIYHSLLRVSSPIFIGQDIMVYQNLTPYPENLAMRLCIWQPYNVLNPLKIIGLDTNPLNTIRSTQGPIWWEIYYKGWITIRLEKGT